MKTDPDALIETALGGLVLADQIDLMHLAVASLSDSVASGDTDLFLDQPGKSGQQKKLYLEKLVAEVRSPELKAALKEPLATGDTEFFMGKNLGEFLSDLDHAVERIEIVRLTVAVEFKERDIRQLVELLAHRLGRPVAFDLTVDKSLIGGAVIRLGNYITDYSISSRLARFREEWKAAAFDSSPAS